MALKLCKSCGEEKDTALFSINRSKKDGLHYLCKPCDSAKASEWYLNNKDKQKQTKFKYKLENKEKVVEIYRKSYEKNKLNVLKRSRDYYVKNKEIIKDKVKSWQNDNKDKVKTYMNRNYVNNKQVYIAKAAQKRAAKLRATPKWLSFIELAQIQEMYDVALAISVQTGIKHHVDHIHPLNGDGFNGLHVPWNLRVISAFENLSKGNKLPPVDQHFAWSSQSPSTVASPTRG